MALRDLLVSLEREATAEANALLADARSRAAKITADANARVAQRRHQTLAAAESALRSREELATAQARVAARARTLQARERAIERVLAAVTASLPAAAASPAFRASLDQRLAAARVCLGDTPAVLRCAPVLAPALREAAAATPGLSVVEDASWETGFVLSASDGSLDVDESLATRLAQRRPELTVEIVRAITEAVS